MQVSSSITSELIQKGQGQRWAAGGTFNVPGSAFANSVSPDQLNELRIRLRLNTPGGPDRVRFTPELFIFFSDGTVFSCSDPFEETLSNNDRTIVLVCA